MYFFLDDMIEMKNLDLNKIKTDQKSNKVFLFTTLNTWRQIVWSFFIFLSIKYMGTFKKVMGVNICYYVLLIKAETHWKWMKNYSTIKDLNRSVTNRLHNSRLNNSDNYDEKYMQIEFTLDDDLLLRKH